MCRRSVRENRRLAAGNEAVVARLRIQEARAALLPVGECRLVAPGSYVPAIGPDPAPDPCLWQDRPTLLPGATGVSAGRDSRHPAATRSSTRGNEVKSPRNPLIQLASGLNRERPAQAEQRALRGSSLRPAGRRGVPNAQARRRASAATRNPSPDITVGQPEMRSPARSSLAAARTGSGWRSGGLFQGQERLVRTSRYPSGSAIVTPRLSQ
jgi:hypothetical protein